MIALEDILLNNYENSTEALEQRIIDWNQKRNGLELNIDLEVSMLREEVREFFLASSTAHRLQEFSDFVFVYIGSTAKIRAKSLSSNSPQEFSQIYTACSQPVSWARRAIDNILGVLYKELTIMYYLDDQQIESLLEASLRAVIGANEAKTKEKDGNGKLVKGPDYISPLNAIEVILQDFLTKEDNAM